jgi:hypothetical protein
MPQRLVVTADSSGIPKAEVPFSCMWDLVEYLSFQRVTVAYHYEATHFVVSFPRQDMASAQEVLDCWATSPSPELQPV